MLIQVNANWRLESDSLQWIVQKRRIVKDKERWDGVSFHRRLNEAVLSLARRQVRLHQGFYGPEALIALCQFLDKLEAEISATINPEVNRPGSGTG